MLQSLKGDYAFRRLRKGNAGYAKQLSVRWRADQKGTVRLGIIVNKKVGKAVTRNLVRRRLREAFSGILKTEQLSSQAQFKKLPSCSLIVIAKPDAANASYQDLERALKTALKRSGLLSTGRSSA